MQDSCPSEQHRHGTHDCRNHLTRRTVVAGSAAVIAGSLAGCQGGDGGDVPEPITLTTEHSCDVCGMVIPNHPGPSTEIFYRDQQPSGHDNPARFDSTWEAFQYDFQRDWERQVVYVTDYSSVDYSLTQAEGDLLISTHPEADAFVDAESVTFVVGSEVKGAMGRDLIAFSDEADAESFADEHGGSLATLDEVTEETISSLRQS
ncbi:nitrous oxide reductase accessory protein NosL [Halomicrobium urmianum]|uniref:nitrous oxide reductase accessory protein NosL n=1 Tax=Halomicrobium urmianum TaxID=1586233 RepID=UPI001CD9689E|nr:nitrous oxide reductase accessory protein NosL [Halomicrobium urmianum]